MKVDPVIAQIAVGPSGELVVLDTEGKLWCSWKLDDNTPMGGVELVKGQGYEVVLLPVQVKFKRWGPSPVAEPVKPGGVRYR